MAMKVADEKQQDKVKALVTEQRDKVRVSYNGVEAGPGGKCGEI